MKAKNSTKEFLQFIENLKKSICKHRIAFITKDFNALEDVITYFYQAGIICGYKRFTSHNKKYVEVFLRYEPSGYPVIMRCKMISKPSREAYIRLGQLHAESKKFDTGLGILRTAKLGLTTTHIALKNKMGGVFLAKIF